MSIDLCVDVSAAISRAWTDSRQAAASIWKDSQWRKFDGVCNTAISSELKKQTENIQELNAELKRALALLQR